MTSLTTTDPRQSLRQNLNFLREFAKRVVVLEDDSLAPLEDVKDALLQEVWKTGKSFNLTDRDVVMLLYKGILPECY